MICSGATIYVTLQFSNNQADMIEALTRRIGRVEGLLERADSPEAPEN